MKDFYICDCVRHENKIVTSSFVVVAKQIKPKKTGEPYLALTLGDRSGQLEAKMWDNVEEVLDAFEQDDFLKIKGPGQQVQAAISAHDSQAAQAGRFRNRLFADYLPKTTKDVDEPLADADGLCEHFPEPAPESFRARLHGRSRDCSRLPQRPCGQDLASRLHRWIARSRRLSVPLLRSDVQELSADQPGSFF